MQQMKYTAALSRSPSTKKTRMIFDHQCALLPCAYRADPRDKVLAWVRSGMQTSGILQFTPQNRRNRPRVCTRLSLSEQRRPPRLRSGS